MRNVVSTNGQIVPPAEICRQDDVEPEQKLEIERIGRGEGRLVRLSTPSNRSLPSWLLACPEKGFFVPIESESTDVL